MLLGRRGIIEDIRDETRSGEVSESLIDGFTEGVLLGGEEVLGLDEAVDARTGQAEPAQQVEGLGQVLSLEALPGEAADVDVQVDSEQCTVYSEQ
jgi:hypothetical protein